MSKAKKKIARLEVKLEPALYKRIKAAAHKEMQSESADLSSWVRLTLGRAADKILKE